MIGLCRIHICWWGLGLVVGCISITAALSIVSWQAERDKNLATFDERAQLRVNAIAQTFYENIDCLVGLRSAVEGLASSHDFLGVRPPAVESVSNRIILGNPDRVTAAAFTREVDRVHSQLLELQLGQNYADMVAQQPVFELRTFGPNGFVPLTTVNASLLVNRRLAVVSAIGNYRDSARSGVGVDIASNELRFELIEAAVRARTIDVSPPVFTNTQRGRARGLFVVTPVYSNSGRNQEGGTDTLELSIDVPRLADITYPQVNRITESQYIVQQHAHNATDACGDAFRATCLPFTSPEDAMAAYNQSLRDVQAGLRDHPLETCSSRCVDGHLVRGHVIAAVQFATISRQAHTFRDRDSPLALYSEDVTDMAREALSRLYHSKSIDLDGSGERMVQGQEYDEYARILVSAGISGGDPATRFDRIEVGTDTGRLPHHRVRPGLGEFQFANIDQLNFEDPATDEARDRVLQFIEQRRNEDPKQVLGLLIPVGNRLWSIHAAITDEFFQIQGTNAFVAPLLSGCLVTIVIAALLGAMYTVFRSQQLRDLRDSEQARLQAAQKAHEVLVSFIVHEQRNPLHLCSGSLGMLREAISASKRATTDATRLVKAALVVEERAKLRCDNIAQRLIQTMTARDVAGRTESVGIHDQEANAPAGVGFMSDSAALETLGMTRRDVQSCGDQMREVKDLLASCQREYLASEGDMNVIYQGTETLHRLVNDMLDLSRLHQGKLPVTVAPVDPRKLVVAVASSHKSFAQVPLRLHVSSSVPPVILADELRISQILANGLTNAGKFATKGYILLDLSLRMRPVSREVFEEEVGSSILAQAFDQAQTGQSDTAPVLPAEGTESTRLDMLRWMLQQRDPEKGSKGQEIRRKNKAESEDSAADALKTGCLGSCGSERATRELYGTPAQGGGSGMTIESFRKMQLDACADVCHGSVLNAVELLCTMEGVTANSTFGIGPSAMRRVHAMCHRAGILNDEGSGAIVAAMAAVPSAIDRLVAPSELLSEFPAVSPSSALSSSQECVKSESISSFGPVATRGGTSQQGVQALPLRLMQPQSTLSMDEDDDAFSTAGCTSQIKSSSDSDMPLAAGRLNKEGTLRASKSAIGWTTAPGQHKGNKSASDRSHGRSAEPEATQYVLPHLVFRVIDTGSGLKGFKGDGGSKMAFVPFTTGESTAAEARLESVISLSSDQSDSGMVMSSDGEPDHQSKSHFSPTAPDGSASSVAKQKGSGLGLAMAQELSNQMGGSISLRTERRRKRTVLEVVLPLRPPWRVVRRMEAGTVSRLPKQFVAKQKQIQIAEVRAIRKAVQQFDEGNLDGALAECSAQNIHGGSMEEDRHRESSRTRDGSSSGASGQLSASGIEVRRKRWKQIEGKSGVFDYSDGHSIGADQTNGETDKSVKAGTGDHGMHQSGTADPTKSISRGDSAFGQHQAKVDGTLSTPLRPDVNQVRRSRTPTNRSRVKSRRVQSLLDALQSLSTAYANGNSEQIGGCAAAGDDEDGDEHTAPRTNNRGGAQRDAHSGSTMRKVIALPSHLRGALQRHMRSLSGRFSNKSRYSHEENDAMVPQHRDSVQTGTKYHVAFKDSGLTSTEHAVLDGEVAKGSRWSTGPHKGITGNAQAATLEVPATEEPDRERTVLPGILDTNASDGVSPSSLPQALGGEGMQNQLSEAYVRGMSMMSTIPGTTGTGGEMPNTCVGSGRVFGVASLSVGPSMDGARRSFHESGSALQVSHSFRSALQGLHVLVVDDERALRRMASRMLERMGVTSEDLDDGKHCETVLRQRGQIPSMGDLPLDTKISRGAEVGGMREREEREREREKAVESGGSLMPF